MPLILGEHAQMLPEYFDFADRQSDRCGVRKTLIRTSIGLYSAECVEGKFCELRVDDVPWVCYARPPPKIRIMGDAPCPTCWHHAKIRKRS